MTGFLWLKLAHILSAAILFGTGLGIAFFLFAAHRSRDIAALRVTARNVILADWVFTAVAVTVQPVTGVLLMQSMGLDYGSAWFVAVGALYALAAACWIPVVVLQYRLARLVRMASSFDDLPLAYHRLFRRWCLLGVPAFSAVLLIYALMVIKPGLG